MILSVTFFVELITGCRFMQRVQWQFVPSSTPSEEKKVQKSRKNNFYWLLLPKK